MAQQFLQRPQIRAAPEQMRREAVPKRMRRGPFAQAQPRPRRPYRAPDRATVDQIYRIGRERGHLLDRAPALAPHIHPDYYAGYLRDPDGRLIEFVCHASEG